MRSSTLKYIFILNLLLVYTKVLAQTRHDTTPPAVEQNTNRNQRRGSLNEEIEIIRSYRPILSDAAKIRINPNLNNKSNFRPQLLYTIIDKKLKIDSNITQLKTQKRINEKVIPFGNHYLKVAAGNFWNTLGEIYLNNGKDEALHAGLYIKHLSQQGNLARQRFSHQELSTFGRSIGQRMTLAGRLKYDRKQTYFYGFNPALTISAADPAKQTFNFIEAEGELSNNYVIDNLWTYKIGVRTCLFDDLFNAKESNLIFFTSLGHLINEFNFGINTSIDLTHSKNAASALNNHIFKINPHVQFQSNKFFLNLGLHIIQEYGDQSRLNILPALSASLPISSAYASIFAGMYGDIIKTTLKNFSDENPYLSQNITIMNAVEKMNIYGGIKGNAGHHLGFKVIASYKAIQNMHFFENIPSNINRFNVIYDQGISSVFGFNGDLEIKISDAFDIIGNIHANNYKMSTEKEAWLHPTLRFGANARVKINSQLSLDAGAIMSGKTFAKLTDPNPNAQAKSVEIDSYTDISAGGEYRITKNTGLYIRAKNLLNIPYEQYLYYPKLGLNIFGGFNYSF